VRNDTSHCFQPVESPTIRDDQTHCLQTSENFGVFSSS
jgi:hypothetical protein